MYSKLRPPIASARVASGRPCIATYVYKNPRIGPVQLSQLIHNTIIDNLPTMLDGSLTNQSRVSALAYRARTARPVEPATRGLRCVAALHWHKCTEVCSPTTETVIPILYDSRSSLLITPTSAPLCTVPDQKGNRLFNE